MQNRDDDDLFFLSVKEERVRESSEQHAPERSVEHLKREWMSAREFDCVVNAPNEVMLQLRRNVGVPLLGFVQVAICFFADDDGAAQSFKSDARTSSQERPALGFA